MNKKLLKVSIVASLLLTSKLLAVEELSEILVVSASKSEQLIKDITANVEIITEDEIEEKNYTSVVEILNTLPGISFSRNGGIGSSTNLYVRGMDNNRTLILIDGIKFKDHSSIGGTDIANLMITDIQRIEIIKGAQSGIWGADAAAGVINIITKKAKGGVSIGLSSEYGSFNTKKIQSNISYANEIFDLNLTVQRLTSDGFTSKTIKNEDIKKFEDDGYENTTLNLNTNYYINPKSKIKFGFMEIDSLSEYDLSGPNDKTMKNDANSRIYNFKYEQEYKKHFITAKYDYSEIKRDQIGATFGVKDTKSKNKNLEIMDRIYYSKKDFVLLGSGINEDKINYTKVDESKKQAKNQGKFLYLTNSNFWDKWIFTESFRYDNYDNFENKLTGKIGTKYAISNDFVLNSNFGTSYSVPLLIKNINPWGNTNFDIEPEEGKSFDFGFEYKKLKVTYFYQKITNLIDWYDPTPNDYTNNDAIYKNEDGESTIKGIEVSYEYEILDDLLINLNYTKLNAENEEGKFLANRAKDEIKTSFDYYGFSKFHINLNSQYIGDRYSSLDEKGTQTGRYTIWNTVVNYKIDDNIRTYVKVNNIFDKDYEVINGYATVPQSIYVGLKVKF